MLNSLITRSTTTLVAVTLLAGCSASRQSSLKAWQEQTQAWVTDHGNGDMNSLRAIEVAPNRPGLRVFSADRPEESKDFVGVLVGAAQQSAPPRAWYVYVLGQVENEQLKSTRLAAVSETDGNFAWQTGNEDQAATAAYLKYRDSAWRAQHPGAAKLPRGALSFPQPDDLFEMQMMGDAITVRETASGAQWNMSLAPTPKK